MAARLPHWPAHGLPERWAGRPRFVMLDTGFGLGHDLLATWAAWRASPQRCQRLWVLSQCPRLPSRAALQQAHAGTPLQHLAAALCEAWPPAATPDIHLIALDGGQVRLLLAQGEPQTLMRQWVAAVDAFTLDAGAPVQPLARLAAEGATLCSPARGQAFREALRVQGWQWAEADGATVARFAPRVRPRCPPGRQAQAPRSALVVGAGLAGALTARALQREGVACTVLEALAAPAQATSGNPAGLFHGVVHGHDGPHARWLRASALHTTRLVAEAMATGGVPGAVDGLLRLAPGQAVAALQSLAQASGLPAEHAQAVDAAAASALAGVPLAHAGWWFPQGGWVDPAALVRWALDGVALRCNAVVARLQQAGNQWQALDAQGQPLGQADAVVLANAGQAMALLPQHAAALPRWQHWRGQVSVLTAPPNGLRVPVAGAGYALPLPGGQLLCGATRQADDTDPRERPADHELNLAQLAQWWPAAAQGQVLHGRVGWRMTTRDRLPLLGPVALAPQAGARPLTQPRLLPRLPGLYLHSALGSRGIAQAALGAEVLASWISGAPVPLAAELMDAVDAGRGLIRN